MNISITTYSKTLIALAAAVLLASPAASVKAADLGLGGDTGWVDAGYYDTASPSYGGDTGWVDTGYYDTANPTYGSGYSPMNYGTPSFGGGSFGSMPLSFGGGSWGVPSGNSSAVSSVYAPSTLYAPTTIDDHTYAPILTNTCTAVNSCNTSYDDHSVFNAPTTITTTNPAPVIINNSTPNYSYPQPVYTPQYQYQSQYQQQYQAPVAYNYPPSYQYAAAPYVSLSAVPYTGLDLGPVGTTLYWSFLVLWSLAAAYLIAVKKVQNKVFASLNNFFYGSASQLDSKKSSDLPSSGATLATPASQTFSHQAATAMTGIDSFIQSQINRARA